MVPSSFFPAQFSSVRGPARTHGTWWLLAAFFALLLVGPTSSAAQESRTQQVQLEQGWNLVSLNVQPADSSFASIFGANADQIDMAKNEEGAVYAPGEGIEQITTWKSEKGYQVYATEAVTLEVSGTAVRPDSMPIVLEEGGNIVPYLSTSAQATETALRDVDASLVLAEDEGGNVYEPSRSSPSLDSLHPGHAYKVYVDQKDTLRYPLLAKTLGDALGLTSVPVGSYVRVRGHHEPGDGGGGLFQVTESTCETDGGICFIFDEDLAYVTGASSISHTDLSWRNTKVRYGPAAEDVVGMLHLSGFHWNSSSGFDPWIDLKNGTADRFYVPFDAWANNLGDGRTPEYTYAHTSTDRRLERIGLENGVSPAWWGAPKANPDNPRQADAFLRWAILAASELWSQTDREWGHVNIDGTYYYLHQLDLLSGVKIRGTGSLNADGYTRGTLKTVPGETLDYRLNGFDMYGGDANSREDVYMMYGDLKKVNPSIAKGTSKFGFENMKIDGNVRSNMQVFNNLGEYNDPEGHMQNSGAWTGFYSTFANAPDSTTAYWKDVNVVDMGGSGLALGNESEKANVIVNRLNVTDARRNHLVYGLKGSDLNNITLQGQFWGGNPLLDPRGYDQLAEVTNLTMKNLETGQFGFDAILSAREAAGPNGGLKVDGFTIDLRGLAKSSGNPISDILKSADRGNEYRNGTIRGMLDGDYGFSSLPKILGYSGGFADKVQRRSLLKDVEVIDHGEPMHLYDEQDAGVTDALLKDVTYRMADGVSANSQPIPFISGTRERSSAPRISDRQMRVKHENVSVEVPTARTFSWKAGLNRVPPYYPADTYHVGGSLNTGYILADLNQFDTNDDYAKGDGERAIRLFINETTISSKSGSAWHIQFRPELRHVIRVRNVSDRNERTSDQVDQSYTATSDDETNGYALIPTSLISRAWATDVTANAGYNVTSVEIANADGTLRADDNSGQRDPYLKVSVDGSITQGDTFTWTARVTPQNYYRTTGTFIARRVRNRSFTSGNGPFTVDLRGVASAQNMDMLAKPTYTASSGSAGVVTANVQSDDYTLELTEQSAGTATITVTGKIPNVGTAETTFEVTIE